MLQTFLLKLRTYFITLKYIDIKSIELILTVLIYLNIIILLFLF